MKTEPKVVMQEASDALSKLQTEDRPSTTVDLV